MCDFLFYFPFQKNREEGAAYITHQKWLMLGRPTVAIYQQWNCRKEEGDLSNETEEEISGKTKKEEMKCQYNLSNANLMLLKGNQPDE